MFDLKLKTKKKGIIWMIILMVEQCENLFKYISLTLSDAW